MKSNFLLRTLTGIVYVVLIVSGIMASSLSFLALFSLIVLLCLWEFYGLMNNRKGLKINRWYNCFGGLLLFISSYLYASGAFSHSIFYPYLLYIVVSLISTLYEKQADPITHIACVFLGQVYIAIPISVLNLIAFPITSAGEAVYYPVMLLALFVFIWVNDSGAYLVGVKFGRHRLFERISPKKSWEGFFGGLVLSVASSFVFAHFVPIIPFYHWMGLAASIVIFGTWGDLIESLIKRNLDVKDSGTAMPGHGGFLDRLDSVLLAVYAVLFYTNLFIQN